MSLSPRSLKLGSFFLALAALAISTTGCFVATGVDGTVITTDPSSVGNLVAQIAIDPGASMTATPGEGVGIFIQYAEGGHWSVFTTCDTATTGKSCAFDVVVSADSDVALSSVRGLDLEVSDTLALQGDGSIRLVTDTSLGTNGMSFDSDPGAIVEFDVLLDGVAQPRFVFVVSDGEVLEGVPTNPVDFAPAGF